MRSVAPGATLMSNVYDCIVIGVGGMGAAALYELARRRRRVLGLEQFDVPNELGSSGNQTRVYRFAYFEHPAYVPLMRHAHERWIVLQKHTCKQLVHPTGCLTIGPRKGRLVTGAINACRIHGLAHEVLSATEIARRFPAWRLPDGQVAVYEPAAGFLRSDRCVSAHVEAALNIGAEVHVRERVIRWYTRSARVVVMTAERTYEAASLVITAGAWVSRMVPALAQQAIAERQVVAWFDPSERSSFAAACFPVFGLEAEDGIYYGFPQHDVPGFKFARYHHRGESCDPDLIRRDIDESDITILREALRRFLPAGDGPLLAAKTCLFTNSPDGHFIIDRLPGEANVALAAGFSGHGFKFCSVVGEVLADLVCEGSTSHHISLFKLDRLQRHCDPARAD
jgi:sarcosine oxidase